MSSSQEELDRAIVESDKWKKNIEELNADAKKTRDKIAGARECKKVADHTIKNIKLLRKKRVDAAVRAAAGLAPVRPGLDDNLDVNWMVPPDFPDEPKLQHSDDPMRCIECKIRNKITVNMPCECPCYCVACARRMLALLLEDGLECRWCREYVETIKRSDL